MYPARHSGRSLFSFLAFNRKRAKTLWSSLWQKAFSRVPTFYNVGWPRITNLAPRKESDQVSELQHPLTYLVMWNFPNPRPPPLERAGRRYHTVEKRPICIRVFLIFSCVSLQIFDFFFFVSWICGPSVVRKRSRIGHYFPYEIKTNIPNF